MLYLTVILLSFVLTVLGRVQMENSEPRLLGTFPSGWKASESLLMKESLSIELTFAIKQQNIDSLDKRVMEMSTPASPKYGQIMTLEEVNKFTAPQQDSIVAVRNLLASFNVTTYSYSSGFVRAVVPMLTAEAMLQTKYSRFQRGERFVYRCNAYSLPDDVAVAVDFVAPTVNFPPVDMRLVTTQPLDSAASSNTPDSLRKLYGVGNTQGTKNKAARQAVTAFLEQYYEEKDLQAFYAKYFPALSGTPFNDVVGPNLSKGGIEAALDVEYISTLGSGVPSDFWSFAGRQPDNKENEPFLDWLYLLGNTTDVPLIFSTSYGEDEWSVTLEYANRMNEEFLKGGARGVSFLFASGDSGVGSAFGSCTTFTPMFPSDSPYVTAVGATTGVGPETAASLSSGGFSNRWAQPAWQASAVDKFLKTSTKLPAANLFNATGRAFPDVSAQGTGYVVINNGVTYPSVAGTSASCPVVAGIFALLNDARLAKGKSPMGFLNPFIYTYGSLFTDVTSGNNPGCGTTGFFATAAWDPVTGWGTPNFTKLLEAALALP